MNIKPNTFRYFLQEDGNQYILLFGITESNVEVCKMSQILEKDALHLVEGLNKSMMSSQSAYIDEVAFHQ